VLCAAAYPAVGGAWHPQDVVWGVLSGAAGVIAIALLYACLAIGPMSILSPLTAVVSAVAPMLWGLLVGGETLGAAGYAGLGVALVAVVLVGFVPGEGIARPTMRGVLYAVGSGVAIGALIVLLDQTGDDSGVVPLLVNRATSAAVTWAIVGTLIIVAVRAGRPASAAFTGAGPRIGATPSGHADLEHAAERTDAAPLPPGRSTVWVAIGCGVADTAANVLLLLALRTGDLAVVGALTALYPAGTILLAAVVLRERIAAVQWAGLALAVAAGALLAIG
jgi:drug/metabolite transporter (DMT)-like permease